MDCLEKRRTALPLYQQVFLDCKPYHEFSENVTWQDCTLRSWLNHEFLVSVFSTEEREKILLSNVKNPAGNTQDCIFLLSADEVEELFDDEEEGKYNFISCVNFDGYIEWAAQGVEETDCCIRPAFWLRTD